MELVEKFRYTWILNPEANIFVIIASHQNWCWIFLFMDARWLFSYNYFLNTFCHRSKNLAIRLNKSGIFYKFIFHSYLPESSLENSAESYKTGGYRVTTFMVYLSDVEAGGYTIFPQVKVEHIKNEFEVKI